MRHTMDWSRYKPTSSHVYCVCGLKQRSGVGWPDTPCVRKKKTKRPTRARSSVTGKFVSAKYAKRHPRRTVVEKV